MGHVVGALLSALRAGADEPFGAPELSPLFGAPAAADAVSIANQFIFKEKSRSLSLSCGLELAAHNNCHSCARVRKAMTQTPPFEVPQQLREVAEKNVEQARAAFDQIEVTPISWTPEHLCCRSPQWQERNHLTRRSSGVR